MQCNLCEICFYCCCAFLEEMSNWFSSSRCALNLIYTKLLQINSLLVLTVNPVYWVGITSQLVPKWWEHIEEPALHTTKAQAPCSSQPQGQASPCKLVKLQCFVFCDRLWNSLMAGFSALYLSFKHFINRMLTPTLWTECCVLLPALALPFGYMQHLKNKA